MNNADYSFVRTIVPKEQYKEREILGEMAVTHLDAVYNKEMDAYECVECAARTADIDEAAMAEAYEAYKAERKASELAYVKGQKLQEVDAYDVSDEVNGFEVNGSVAWLDKATRVGLMNSTTIAKAAGEKSVTLWLGEQEIVMGCDEAVGMLSKLEMYALECFNVTARHRKEVQELETAEDVAAYDVTEGYPERLAFELASE